MLGLTCNVNNCRDTLFLEMTFSEVFAYCHNLVNSTSVLCKNLNPDSLALAIASESSFVVAVPKMQNKNFSKYAFEKYAREINTTFLRTNFRAQNYLKNAYNTCQKACIQAYSNYENPNSFYYMDNDLLNFELASANSKYDEACIKSQPYLMNFWVVDFEDHENDVTFLVKVVQS